MTMLIFASRSVQLDASRVAHGSPAGTRYCMTDLRHAPFARHSAICPVSYSKVMLLKVAVRPVAASQTRSVHGSGLHGSGDSASMMTTQ